MRANTAIRFRVNYQKWLQGQVIDPGYGAGLEFVRRGLADWVDDTGPILTQRKRGRPRGSKNKR